MSSGFTKPVTGGPSSYIWFRCRCSNNLRRFFSGWGQGLQGKRSHRDSSKIFRDCKIENIDIFNPPVLSLILDSSPDGATTAQYVGGGGSDELYFEYIVQDGDNTAFLNVKELVLNGADLKTLQTTLETFMRRNS